MTSPSTIDFAAGLRGYLLARGHELRGRELKIACAFHEDARPSCRVDVERGCFFCDVCHQGGGALDLVAALENCDRSTAIRVLEGKATIAPARTPRPAKPPAPPVDLGGVLADYRASLRGPSAQPALEWLAENWGVSLAVLRGYGVGLAPPTRGAVQTFSLAVPSFAAGSLSGVKLYRPRWRELAGDRQGKVVSERGSRPALVGGHLLGDAEGRTVLVVGGEKDAMVVAAALPELVAVAHAGGEGAWAAPKRATTNDRARALAAEIVAARPARIVVALDVNERERGVPEAVATFARAGAVVHVVEWPQDFAAKHPKGGVAQFLLDADFEALAFRALVEAARPLATPPCPEIPMSTEPTGAAVERALVARANGSDLKSVSAWPPLVPLDSKRGLPPFPVESLPAPFDSFVSALADYTQTPADMGGCLVLAAVSAAVRGKYVVRGRWTEVLGIFNAVVAAPGEAKSPPFRAVFGPLYEYENERRRSEAPARERALAVRRALEHKQDALEKNFSRAKNEEAAAAQRALEEVTDELGRAEVPPAFRLLVDDVTPEILGQLLAENGSLCLASHEGGVFGTMLGRYSKNGSPNFDVFLKAYDGDRLSSDRVSRAEVRAEHPVLSVAVCVQPDVVRALGDDSSLRGRGLLGRFNFVFPASAMGFRRVDAPVIPKGVSDAYARALGALLELSRVPAESSELVVEGDALEVHDAFRQEIEPRLRPNGDLREMTDWAAKLYGKILRLAGVLHVAALGTKGGSWTTRVTRESVERAVAIGRYLIPHARAAFALVGSEVALENARFVVERMASSAKRDGSLGWTIKRGDLYEVAPSRIKTGAHADAVLEVLLERRYLRTVTRGEHTRPGRPGEVFAVHPDLTASWQPNGE